MKHIQSLNLVLDFISSEEELEIVSNIPESKTQRNRRSAINRYGSIVYRNFITSDIIPEWLLKPAIKLVEQKLLDHLPKHVTINTYYPGNFISAHIDNKESGEIITVLSLLSTAEMILSKGKEKQSIILPSKSLLQLKDDARWEWEHSILPVKDLRYSIVYRD